MYFDHAKGNVYHSPYIGSKIGISLFGTDFQLIGDFGDRSSHKQGAETHETVALSEGAKCSTFVCHERSYSSA